MDEVERSSVEQTSTVYDGFISYSHAADDLLAPRLQAGLQGFAKPWWKRRAVRVFRDESSLSANPHLWSSITDALDESAWFVLLLSPDAASSEWVNQEIDYWKTHKDASRILPVLTDGTFEWAGGDVTGDAAPEALQGVFSEEPRWVDMRFAHEEEQLDLKNPRFSAAVADIASALRGVPKDELESEEVKQHRRTIRTAWAAGVLVLLLGIAAVFAAIQASQNAAEAQRLADSEAAARIEADSNAKEAERQAAIAEANAALATARELAASAVNVVDEDPELSLLLALEAIDSTPAGREQPAEVIDALWTAGTRHRLIDILDPQAGEFAVIDLSSDGSVLAVVNVGGATLQVYDTETLEPLWKYQETTSDGLTSVRFSPDGTLLSVPILDSEAFTALPVDPQEFPELAEVADGDEQPARTLIFDVSTGNIIETLLFPSCRDIAVTEWSPDGRHLAVGLAPPGVGERCIREGSPRGQWVEIFDTSTWESLKLLDIPMQEEAFASPVPAFDSEGNLYVFRANSRESGSLIYTAADYELRSDLAEVTGALAVSPDGSLFGVVDGFSYSLNSTEDGQTEDRLTGADARPKLPGGLGFSPTGRLLHSITNGSDAYVWDVETGERLFRLRGGDGSRGVYDPMTERLYTGHADGLVRIWNLGQPTFGRTPVGDLGTAEWVNGTPFAIGPEFGMFEAIDLQALQAYVMLFDLETGALRAEALPGNKQLALPDGRFVYARDYFEFVIYDPATGAETYLLGCEPEDDIETCVGSDEPFINYRSMHVSLEGNELAALSQAPQAGGSWFELTLLDSATGEIVGRERHERELSNLYSFSNDWIFYDDHRQGMVIDRRTGDVVWESGFRITRFNESPSRSLYSVLDFNTVHIIEAGSWESRALPFDFGEVRGMAFSEDETLLALGDERHLSIVDLTTDQIVLRVPIEGVSDAYWIDEKNILVGTKNGVWAVVSLSTEQLVRDARDSVLRSFTEQECVTYRIDPCSTLDEIKEG